MRFQEIPEEPQLPSGSQGRISRLNFPISLDDMPDTSYRARWVVMVTEQEGWGRGRLSLSCN